MSRLRKRLRHWWEGHDWWFQEPEDFYQWLGHSTKRENQLVFKCRVCGKLKRGYSDNLDALHFAEKLCFYIDRSGKPAEELFGIDLAKLAKEELDRAVLGLDLNLKTDFPQLVLDIC